MKKITKKGIEYFIDKQDDDFVSKIVWRFDHGYIRSTVGYLHRYLLDFPESRIDHIDGNPLNNCRSNLRICTQQQNLMNKKKSKNASSRFKGVSWNKRENIWYTYINKNYKTHYIGRFRDEIEAAKAYDTAAKAIFGDFARLNYE